MTQIFKDKCYFPDSDSQAFIYSTCESLVLMQGWGEGGAEVRPINPHL